MGKYLKLLQGEAETQEPISFEVPNTVCEEGEAKPIYETLDPRADKSVDHRYWEDLLWNAWHFTKPLYYILHGIRCGGGELTLTKASFRLLRGDWSAEEWDEIKQKYLDPARDKLVSILKLTRVGKVTEEELPEGLFDSKPGAVPAPAQKVEEQGRLF